MGSRICRPAGIRVVDVQGAARPAKRSAIRCFPATTYLWRRQGDAINAILAAVGYNFRRLIRWLSYLVPNPRPTRGSTSGPP